MANITGEYDVVVEVGVNVLNGILGAVHENQDTNFPTMPHSLNLVVDDTFHGAGDPVPESDRTGIVSRVEVQVSTPIVSLPVDVIEVRPEVFSVSGRVLAGRSDPYYQGGVASPSGSGGSVIEVETDPRSVVGIFVPPTRFSFPRITAKVRVRALVRDPTEGRLPEFLDGDLFVTTALVRSDVDGVGTFITLDRTNGPLVTFQPAAGTEMTDDQRDAVASIVRNVIRGDTDPATFKVSLPSEIKHFDFELEPEARRPSIMLLFTLTDRTPGPGARDSVGPGLLPDGADFAVGVGRDFVLDTVRSLLFQDLPSELRFSKAGISATVRPDLNSVTFDLEPGRILFSVSGDGEISAADITDHFTFTIQQAFTLQVVDGGLEPVADGDPVVDLEDIAVGGDFLEGKARDEIKQERDAALAAGASQFREKLGVGGQVEQILSGINPQPAGVSLSGVDIRPDGLLIRRTIGLAASGPVVVTETGRDGFNDGLDSFIPGGTIDRFVWQQSSFPGRPPVVRVEEHRFVTESTRVSIFSTLCLRVEGTRVTAGGGAVPVSGAACFRFSPVVAQVPDLPPDIPKPLLPLLEPGARGGLRVVGHYDPFAPGRAPAKGHASLLLHFGSGPVDETAKLLRDALDGARKRKAAVLGMGVLPSGELARGGQGAADDLLLIEDPYGQWAEAFGISEPPATVLVGPRGDVVWRDRSAITAKKLGDAVGKYAKVGGELAVTPIRLAVRLGERPPDARLRLSDGSELSLRRLKGRPVALTFWTSRSAPSIDQLEYLRGLQADGDRRAPIVIAVGDGEGPERVAELVEEREFPFLVLADPDRLVSRAFGVWCWPATVWIRTDGRIEAIDLGLTG